MPTAPLSPTHGADTPDDPRAIVPEALRSALSRLLAVLGQNADSSPLLRIRFEGGNAEQMLQRAADLIRSGVTLITLLALSDEGHPGYHEDLGRRLAALGSPCFACTPDQFPDLMAAALRREDLNDWAAQRDIAVLRGW